MEIEKEVNNEKKEVINADSFLISGGIGGVRIYVLEKDKDLAYENDKIKRSKINNKVEAEIKIEPNQLKELKEIIDERINIIEKQYGEIQKRKKEDEEDEEDLKTIR